MKNRPKHQWQAIAQWICYVALIQSLLFCKRGSTDPQPVTTNPVNSGIVFKNTQVSNLADTRADVTTDLELSNGKKFSEHGHCWSDTKITPTIDDNRAKLGAVSTNTTLKSQMTSLTKGTRYYARSYGVTDEGVVYGDVTSFTTTNSPTPTNPPTVETAATTDVTTNSLTVKGKITANGSSDVTEYGICWVQGEATPTLSDGKVTATNRDGTGAFSASITSLTASTTYSLRAYATNASGTSYGNIEKIRTADIPAANAPTVETDEVNGATTNTLNAKGRIVNNGSSAVTEYGFVYAEGDVLPLLGSSNRQTASNRDGAGNFSATLAGLGSGKVFSVRAYATNGTGTTYGGKLTGTTTNVVVNTPPAVETNEVNGATINTLNVKGRIVNNGSSDITEYGFVYGEGEVVPELGNATKQTASNRDGNGSFSATLAGLGSGKVFSIRAYAINSDGTTYGAKLTGTTTNAVVNTPPTIETGDVSNIGQTSATAKGKLTNIGSSAITEYGVCWVVGDATPTINNNKATGANLTNGDFSIVLAGLAVYSNYSVRAFATNSAGTSYGVKKTFRTDAGRPTLETVEAKNISYTTATVTSKITLNGSSIDNVTSWGVCYVQGNSTPTTVDPKVAGGNRTDGAYSSSITGLSAGTTYTARAYIVFSTITIYGENKSFRTTPELVVNPTPPTVETTEVSLISIIDAVVLSKITANGGSAITTYGVCWVQGETIPTIANNKADGAGLVNGAEYATILGGLTANTRYTVRAYATNSAGTSYGASKSFLTKSAPTVETVEFRNIGSTSAGVYGKITANGSSAVTTYGVCWVKGTGTPTIANSKIAATNLNNGNFSQGLTGLDHATSYTVRAYATNGSGTGYGDKKTFTTSP